MAVPCAALIKSKLASDPLALEARMETSVASETRVSSESPGAPAGAVVVLRFGPFELDLRTSELRRDGRIVKLQQQPCRVLALLARRQGQLVTREQIRHAIWSADTFVDFEQGLNFCVRQVRAALADQAQQPRYVETLPRRGYRFLAPVEAVYERAAEPVVGPTAAATPPDPIARATSVETRHHAWPASLALLGLLLVGGLALLSGRPAASTGQATPERAGERVLLAVLPFENLSGDDSQDYVGDGLTDEMITQLARLAPQRLGVIARTSAMRYKGRATDVAEVGEDLGVGYVIEGSVRRAGERLRVSVQLVETGARTHLWAASYDEPVADVLVLQERIARRIAEALAPRLLPADTPPAGYAARAQPAAYDAYLRGRAQWGRGTPEALRASRVALRRAVALDPSFARAHVALAETYIALGDRELLAPQEAYPAARAAAERAIALDPGLAEAYVPLGVVRAYYEWDLTAGWSALSTALRLNPGLAWAHHAVGDYYSALGRHDEAIAAARRAKELDPVSAAVGQDLGWYLYFARRYDEAALAFERALELDPNDVGLRRAWANALAFAGRWDEALEVRAQASAQVGVASARLAPLRALGGQAGYLGVCRLDLERARRLPTLQPGAAMLHANLGEHEDALRLLEHGVNVRWRWALLFIAGDPRLDVLRSQPRFQALLRRMNLPSRALSPQPSAQGGPA
jgi:TolB-like protein/DNA-binding winged helix-turn-helix (wHTH) protein/Tfp pilus assembly protein PilF